MDALRSMDNENSAGTARARVRGCLAVTASLRDERLDLRHGLELCDHLTIEPA